MPSGKGGKHLISNQLTNHTMIYLRPQKTYRAPAISDGRNENELFPPTDQSRYRVVAEALRGRVISNDNPQLCFTALIFDARDGSELTERLKENGFRPGWYLDGKAVDASLITDGGYTLTIGKEQLTNAFVRLTLCARDTDILLALVHPDYRPIYERVIAQGAISSVVIEQSEDLVNQILLDELNKSALTEIKRYFTLEISKKADKSELITPEQIKELAHALDEERKTEWRNLLISDDEHTTEEEIATTDYLYRKLLLSRKHTFVIGDYYTLSMDVQVPNDASGLDGYNIFDWNGHVNKYGYRGDTFTIHNGRNHITFKWGEAGSELSNVGLLLYRNFGYSENPNTTKYTIKTANFTLVKGKEGMDTYTPAPEDMLAELSKYTTLKKYNEDREEDSRKLEGKLDKPTSGKYILDTDIPKQFEELMKVGGRNLIKHGEQEKRTWGEWASYTLYKPIEKSEPLTLSFDVLNVEVPPDGGSFLIYFFYYSNFRTRASVRYEEGKKRYNVTVSKLDFNYSLYGDKKNYNPNQVFIYPNNDYKSPGTGGCFTIANIKLERGNVATDWTPAPEDFEGAITDLKKNTLTEIEKEWVGKMGSILFPNMEDSPQNKGGLSIDRSMFLRFSDGKPSALIGGQIGDRSGGNAILMAGVNGYGTDNLSARTAIYQDGTARFGDVNLSDKTISLMPKSGLPLRVTAEDGTFIENFLANSKVDKNIAYEHSFVLVGKGEARTYSFDVANNDTKLTITIPTLTSEVYQINQSVTLTLDGVTLGSWRGDTKLIREDTSGFEGGGVRFRKENTPLVVENLKFERYLNSGSHTLSVSVTSTDTKDKATISKLTAHLYYDASQAETNLTRYGFRAFGGQSRYFDIDWRWTYRYKGYMTTSNPYIARVKGGMRVDSLTLEQPLDAPGCVLAGGEVDSNGQVTKSFGRYKKKQGDNTPSTKFDYNTHYYTVYHSINNTNYIPIVTSRSSAWADVPRVMSVSSNSFTIAFINETNKVSDWRQPFIYTCYKAD